MQQIWFKDIHSFVSYKNLANFFPVHGTSKISQLNALFRFSLYLSLVLYIYNHDDKVFLLPLLTGVYTFVEYNMIKSLEGFYERPCHAYRTPTRDNPFMNPNLVSDRCPDSRARFNRSTRDQVEMMFQESDFARESSSPPTIVPSTDYYQKESERKQFYTVPSTNIPSDQESFATYLYGSLPSSKRVVEY